MFTEMPVILNAKWTGSPGKMWLLAFTHPPIYQTVLDFPPGVGRFTPVRG